MSRYLGVAIGLTILGFLSGFSLGPTLMVPGLALLILAPVRRRQALFVPGIAAALGFVAGWWLTAPLGCVATETTAGAATLACRPALLGALFPDQSMGALVVAALAAASVLAGQAVQSGRRRPAGRS